MSDKLDVIYDIRITAQLKQNLQKLEDDEKKKMLKEINDLMARHIHNCRAVFDPTLYQNEN